jgi:hypothetical protein
MGYLQDRARFSSSPEFSAFIAGLDWLSAGHDGPFGQQLAALAFEADLDQLGKLMRGFGPEFDRAMSLAQLYEWAQQ